MPQPQPLAAASRRHSRPGTTGGVCAPALDLLLLPFISHSDCTAALPAVQWRGQVRPPPRPRRINGGSEEEGEEGVSPEATRAVAEAIQVGLDLAGLGSGRRGVARRWPICACSCLPPPRSAAKAEPRLCRLSVPDSAASAC